MISFDTEAERLQYEKIISDPDHLEITKAVIDGVEYFEDVLESAVTNASVFAEDTMSIGGAIVGTAELNLRRDDMSGIDFSRLIPRMASVDLYVKVTSKGERDQQSSAILGVAVLGSMLLGSYYGQRTPLESGWIPQGKYFVDTREAASESSRLILHCYDRMSIADADFPSTNNLEWPAKDIDVVNIIADAMGVPVDPITTAAMTKQYYLQLPSSYSQREVLGFIAAMYGGNFIISKRGTLLLVVVNSLPEETNYLLTESGNYLTFGGTRILLKKEVTT